MLNVDAELFVRIPEQSDQRILHPAKVVAANHPSYTVQFEELNFLLEEGQDIFVFYESKHEFMQQAACIEAMLETEPDPTVKFTLIDKPISAENRQCYRVSTVLADMNATLGDEDDCQLLDVSMTGFSVIAAEQHDVGQTMSVTLRYDGREYTGKARIQSVRQLDDNRIRYGLHNLSAAQDSGDVQKGLREISMAVQRRQLRRLAGTS